MLPRGFTPCVGSVPTPSGSALTNGIILDEPVWALIRLGFTLIKIDYNSRSWAVTCAE